MIDRFAAQAMGFPEKIAHQAALPEVNGLIGRTLTQSDPVLSSVMAHLVKGSGKNFRAALLLAASADPAGNVPADAVVAAAALEILHLASLVHDDVIDEAPTRRGLPSVQQLFGKKAAVIGGDYLFCVCFSMVAALSSRYPEKFTEFSRSMMQICVGELRQNQNNGNIDLSYYGYLRTIAGKTAALFALALYSGGILSGDTEKEARLLARFGFCIGMLFQLADDCLDYEATAETLKKAVKHDLGEGVVTLPLILACAADPAIKESVRGRTLSAFEINIIAAAVKKAGGVTKTRAVADRYAQKARKLLGRVASPDKRERLGNILDAIQDREH